jgi:serine/threonine-protein kinase RsbW
VAPDVPNSDDRAPWVEKVLPSRLDMIRQTEHEVEARLLELGYDEDQRWAVRLALEESLVNAMKHGNAMDPNRSVRVAHCITPDRAEIRIADEGGGFDPCCVPDPTADENLHKPCGRGIMLMRSYMDEVMFCSNGTEVHMVKYRHGGRSASTPGEHPGAKESS